MVLFLILILFSSLTVSARNSESTRKGTSLYPLYWTAYEPCFTADAPLDESRWKETIDWVADNLLPYGYNMVTTDGWLNSATQTTENGCLIKYNDNWEHDWKYWVDYCKSVFCGAQRTPMRFRADAMRNITGAPKRLILLFSSSVGSLLCSAL